MRIGRWNFGMYESITELSLKELTKPYFWKMFVFEYTETFCKCKVWSFGLFYVEKLSKRCYFNIVRG